MRERTADQALAAVLRALDTEAHLRRGIRTERECVLDARLRKIIASAGSDQSRKGQ